MSQLVSWSVGWSYIGYNILGDDLLVARLASRSLAVGQLASLFGW
jgi:hypothetical protein